MKKKLSGLALSIFLGITILLGLMTVTSYAAGYGDKGYDTTNTGTYEIDGNYVFVYVTGSGGDVERISGSDGDSKQQYRAAASDNWEFAYWSTYYVGPSTEHSNPSAVLGYYYFSKPGDPDTVYDRTHPVIQVNEEMWAAGVYYLQAIFKPKVTVSVNMDLDASGTSIRGDSPATYLDNVFISGKSGYVPFGGNIEITLTAFKDDYIVQSVTVHDGAPREDFTYGVSSEQLKVNFTATRPTNVNIRVKIKEQNVSFDANTGTGTMDSVKFESGVSKNIPLNTFKKTGHLFDGWNTEADGSGTSYTDGQNAVFKPANDGDTLTLYAQWKKCDHSYSYTSEGNVITETCINGCGHKAAAALELQDDVSTVYTGSEINPLKVMYDHEWMGGTALEITYSNNINAGAATGCISKDGAEAHLDFEISKADYDMSSAKWDYSEPFVYNGREHQVEVVGLPDGVSVSEYAGNTATDPGNYTAKGTLAYDSTNYNAPVIDDLNWGIEDKYYAVSIDEESLKGGTVTVDKTSAREGDLVNITVTVDEGYTFDEVVVFDGNGIVYGNIMEKDGCFVMPGCDVTLAATFNAEAVPEDPTPEDPTPDDPDSEVPEKPAADDSDSANKVAAESDNAPRTGDSYNIWALLLIMIAAGAGIIKISIDERKRKLN